MFSVKKLGVVALELASPGKVQNRDVADQNCIGVFAQALGIYKSMPPVFLAAIHCEVQHSGPKSSQKQVADHF